MKLDESKIKWNANGLIPAIIQDEKNLRVLMLGFMNKEALQKTLTGKQVHFFSRSRKKIWHKGETSGHVQRIKKIQLDCDGDSLLIQVEQKVGACHQGYVSCFYRTLDSQGKWCISEERVFDPKGVYPS